MGTRSLTRVFNGDAQIINLYRQFDGYPDGHGKELFEFLNGMAIVNGYNGSEPKKAANGAGCVAAQMVAHFKKEIGGFYLYPTEATDCGQDYEYAVTVNKDLTLNVSCKSFRKMLFDGSVADFGAFCAKKEDNDEDDE